MSDKLLEHIKLEEGFRGEPYTDTEGYPTIGYGTKLPLTQKEADLLRLLNSSKNTPLKRETILKKVWGDDGDYIGRTLDVFISKLRKKLEAEDKVKIINIRGIGYKLITK